MKHFLFGTALVLMITASAPGQDHRVTDRGNAPIYHVTVVERNIKAVNYAYRSGPTPIDFRGTVLLPEGKGGATVESRQGRTEIDANFQHFKISQQYGLEYLTYVLWAITPEGRPHNLGEIVPDHSNNGHIRVTTDLQAFAMIVTAEPYAAVRQPSDVVVMENQLRPDTAGSTETVNAKYELLPRGQYTWHVSEGLSAELAAAPKVSEREFETLTEIYQAENAVGVAGSAGAQQWAPDTFSQAQVLLREAQQMHTAKADSHRIVEIARQASQTAEDARLITVQRQQQASLNAAQADAGNARQEAAAAQRSAEQTRQQAEIQIQQARQEADAAVQRANALAQQAQRDRDAAAQAQSAAAQAQTAAAAANARAQQAEIAAAQSRPDPDRDAARMSALRAQLLENLNGVSPSIDTPRGLVVTIRDTDFDGNSVRGAAAARIARLSAVVASHPGLQVSVEGYSDTAAKRLASEDRANAVRRILMNTGLSAASVSASGLGDSRPLGPAGQEENTRVEIVISGDPIIGRLPFWDHPYSLLSR
jgi:outer membrane protein OmpA-like peptidoglycan-associated protein